MNIPRILAGALAIAVAGCQGGNAGLPQSATAPSARAFDGKGSWMAPDATQQPLIYASDISVYVYTYSGREVGELGGFDGTTGLCSDTSGDVYVTAGLIYEYARGGSLPIDVIQDPGPGGPHGCAVDPTTSNLAVANSAPIQGTGTGALLVFPPTSSQAPVVYTTPNMTSDMFCTYDSAGNLYVDGVGAHGSFQLAVLRKGSSKLVSIPLAQLNNRNHRAGGIHWDGQDLAVDDALSKVIYRIAVSGSTGSVVDTIKVDGYNSHYIVDFAIEGSSLLFPIDARKLEFFKYPQGGKHTKGFAGKVGTYITVSLPTS